jgi:hypothetical protein
VHTSQAKRPFEDTGTSPYNGSITRFVTCVFALFLDSSSCPLPVRSRFTTARARNEATSTAQHGTAQHGTAHHGTTQYSTAQHGTAQQSTAQPPTAQHNTAQHRNRLGISLCKMCTPPKRNDHLRTPARYHIMAFGAALPRQAGAESRET